MIHASFKRNWIQFSRVLNLVLREAILSIDNAAILTTLVSHLNKEDRKKALKSGIIGASIFRIMSLFFASLIMKMWLLKIIGGSSLQLDI